MTNFANLSQSLLLAGAIMLSLLAGPTIAQDQMSAGRAALSADRAPAKTIKKYSGVWVEGPGYIVKYGISYDACAKRCLSNDKCVMIEYYYPKDKCNIYKSMRKKLSGGSAYVGIKQ